MNIRIVQKKDILYKNGKSPLFLRFTHERKNKFISLGIAIFPEHWDNESQKISPDCPENSTLNSLIREKQGEYLKQIQRLEILEIEVNFDTLFGAKSKRINCTLQEFFTQTIDKLQLFGKHNTVSKYRSTLSLLKQYHKIDIKFEDIDVTFIRDFEAFLRQNGNNNNTIATRISNLKAIYNKAVTEDIFIPVSNPFSKYKVGSLWTKTRKRAINKEDVLKLKELELSEGNSFYLHFARDIFLFSYYMAGINFKDIATLQYADIQNDRMHYSRSKTSKEMNCHIIPEAKRIIDKHFKPNSTDDDYIFPILNRNIHISEQQIHNRIHKVLGKVNTNLKTLSTKIGLKTPLTTYVARHTFATVLKRSGVNIAIISESLGHSDLATTQIYLDSFENSQIDAAMQHLL